MTEAAVAAKKPIPIVSFLRIPDERIARISPAASAAPAAQIFLGDERTVCSACSARGQMKPMTLSNKGELYVFSIVYRSFPGIEMPYISAIVDLEGGGTVKGNLRTSSPTPRRSSSACRSRWSTRSRRARTARATRTSPTSSSRVDGSA